MIKDSGGDPYVRVRTFLRYSWLVVGVALLYVGWVFLSRWQENREIEQRAQSEKRVEEQRTVEMLGGKRFEILHFYASPGVIRRGETTLLCYGVSNAQSVRLEPQTSAVWPSYSRCVTVSPKKSTTYTLTAADSAGSVKTATVLVEVR